MKRVGAKMAIVEQLQPHDDVVPLKPLGARPHIVVVGGGAGGLELATRLGNKYGRWKTADITLIDRSRTHVWKPLLHEIAAGSMDIDRHQLDYLAQAHWHGFTYRFGEMTGIDRAERKVHLAATYDDEGRPITPVRSFSYDILVIAVGSVSNDFGTPGVKDFAITLDHCGAGRAVQPAARQCVPQCAYAEGADPAWAVARDNHRGWCDGYRAFG